MKLSLSLIAESMGMNVVELEETTGYSRQALHLMLNNRRSANLRRWKVAINALDIAIDKEYRLNKQRLEEGYKKHKQAMTDFDSLVRNTKEPCSESMEGQVSLEECFG